MGMLINGIWHNQWYDTHSNHGAFKREAAKLRNWITADGSAGPSGKGGFKAESGRYHLYVSLACPWAHRTLIFRQLKGLVDHVSVSIVSPDMLSNGWSFDQSCWSTGDHLYGLEYLYQLYTKHKSDYSGRVTVPVLWDKQRECIVSNESSEIIRMFNAEFDQITGNTLDLYPGHLSHEIDEVNAKIYDNINNGVYRCGFATTQQAYERAYANLFMSLDWLEEKLSQHAFLVGNQITEADWRLFTTLIRFDPVYHGHFKCNKKLILDCPALQEYMLKLYHWQGVKDTVDFFHIKRHYYYSHVQINPTQIVPVGPDLSYLDVEKSNF